MSKEEVAVEVDGATYTIVRGVGRTEVFDEDGESFLVLPSSHELSGVWVVVLARRIKREFRVGFSCGQDARPRELRRILGAAEEVDP